MKLKKKIPTSRLAVFLLTRHTGNFFLLKGGLSAMQAATTTIFEVFGMTRLTLLVAFYDQQCLAAAVQIFRHPLSISQIPLSIVQSETYKRQQTEAFTIPRPKIELRSLLSFPLYSGSLLKEFKSLRDMKEWRIS